ncbi:MAG TPA: DUF4265 domain-containing protein [Mucilaginibacter sp.]|nr:DUF4265 domain-containing protein [Mucilaginibacter sp.]
MEKIVFEYTDLDGEYAIESAWAQRVEGNYILDNILFYAPGYSWGDIVSVEERNGLLYVTGLIKESGHSTIRIIFYNKEIIQLTTEQLEKRGCRWEGSNIPTLISVDIAPEIDYIPIRKFLDEGEENDWWSYEESCLAHNIE